MLVILKKKKTISWLILSTECENWTNWKNDPFKIKKDLVIYDPNEDKKLIENHGIDYLFNFVPLEEETNLMEHVKPQKIKTRLSKISDSQQV